ncbi:MAG: response regulator [Clostridia bacterium]|nr:response regulator [Clostridia bacterium]
MSIDKNEILSVLAEDFHYVDYINVNPDKGDDEIENIRRNDFIESYVPELRTELKFTKRLDAFMEGIVYGPDRKHFYAATRRFVILEHLKADGLYYVGFRIKTDEGIFRCEMKFISFNEGFVVGGHRIESGAKKEVDHSRILEGLLGDYDAVFSIDADNDTISTIRISYQYGKQFVRIPENSSYSERINDGVLRNVAPKDRKHVHNHFDTEHVLEMLKYKAAYAVQYKVLNNAGEELYYEAKFARIQIEEGNHFVLGIRNVDWSLRESLKNEIIVKCIANDFDCVIYMDLENDFKETFYRNSPLFEELMPGWTELSNFHDRAELFFDRLVYPEDRERVKFEAGKDYVIEQLRNKLAYFCNFRIIINEEIRFYQMKFTADIVDGKAVGIIVGFHDVDDEIRQELERETQLTEAKQKAEEIIMKRTAELRERNRELARTNDEIVELLGDVVEMRDSESGQHIVRVKAFTYILADCVRNTLPEYELTEEDVELITSASALHDVGKILISDAILLKPGKLTDEEFEIMKGHSSKGCDILRKASRNWGAKYLNIALDICHYHHEKWDGRGYPEGLKGDQIPISAQIVSVADCFDALTTKRVYKEVYEAETAFEMIIEGKCGKFSDKLLCCLKACRDAFLEATANPETFIRGYLGQAHEIEILKDLSILLVDDDAISRKVNREILEARGAVVREASSYRETLDLFREMQTLDAIIMDVYMPGMDGIELTRRIRDMEHNYADRVPIVAFTADTNDSAIHRMVDAGADGGITKPLVVSELTKILLSSIRSRSETMERKLAATIRAANTDALTKVKSITAYTDMVADLTDEMKSAFPHDFAIVMSDINGLKNVNDTYGHDVGDVYIKNCCRIICEVFNHSPVFRIGGDEFVAILQGSDYEKREEKIKRLEEKVKAAEKIEDVISGKASFAFGLAEYEREEDISVSDVVKRADERMYENKHK